MKQFIRTYWKTLLFFTTVGLVGGFSTGLYLLNSYPSEIRQQVYDQGLNNTMVGLITAIQTAGYGLFLGAAGIWLGRKTGLWKDEISITKKPLLIALVISVIGGMSMILLDIWFFGKYSQTIMDSYSVKPSIPYLLATVTYGGIIEEVMLRLFMMSLIAFLLHKIFSKKQAFPSTKVLMTANMIAALLFAAGHLPATLMMIGSTPMILFRCFLLNGGFGLTFGWLYQKYGLRYAMIAHGGCHVISKLIWILFI